MLGRKRKKKGRKKKGYRERKMNWDADICHKRRGAASELPGPW